MSSGVLRGSVAFVLVAACARPAPMQPVPGFTPEEEVQAAPPGAIVLPSGARLGVHVDDTLSTETSQPSDTFTGTVIAPVRGADGRVVIQEGAKIRGRVLSVERPEDGLEPRPPPTMRLIFETVDTTMGRRQLRATLATAIDGAVAMQSPPAPPEAARAGAIGGGPASDEPANGAAREGREGEDGAVENGTENGTPAVVIPEGSILELVLVQPLRT